IVRIERASIALGEGRHCRSRTAMFYRVFERVFRNKREIEWIVQRPSGAVLSVITVTAGTVLVKKRMEIGLALRRLSRFRLATSSDAHKEQTYRQSGECAHCRSSGGRGEIPGASMKARCAKPHDCIV